MSRCRGRRRREVPYLASGMDRMMWQMEFTVERKPYSSVSFSSQKYSVVKPFLVILSSTPWHTRYDLSLMPVLSTAVKSHNATICSTVDTDEMGCGTSSYTLLLEPPPPSAALLQNDPPRPHTTEARDGTQRQHHTNGLNIPQHTRAAPRVRANTDFERKAQGGN